MIDDLVKWLRDVLDREAEWARAASGEQPWTAVGDWDTARVEDASGRTVASERRSSEAVMEHIAIHDPRSVLARVSAEKRIVERCMSALLAARVEGGAVDASDFAEHTLTELAYGHRHDAPGWREEWTPTGL